jgi:hypothetical protein
MEQFDVHELRKPKGGLPANEVVVILQHGHARAVETVIVAPLVSSSTLPPLGRIRPPVSLEGRPHIAVIDRLAAVERSAIGPRVGSVQAHRDDLIRAVDTLFTGF